uniref:ORF50/51 n=1 Tax=Cydia pomonella granulosis virus TaxID=28289 RepID=A0A097P0L6_GVCP|nr:ORF50/51 [Cydia pomonella granulovirus]QGY99827.1 ORF50/51 [Cydia pomonella granulovirus]
MNRSVANWVIEKHNCSEREKRIRNLLITQSGLKLENGKWIDKKVELSSIDTEELLVKVLKAIHDDKIRLYGELHSSGKFDGNDYVNSGGDDEDESVVRMAKQRNVKEEMRKLIQKRPTHTSVESVREFIYQLGRTIVACNPAAATLNSDIAYIANNYGVLRNTPNAELDRLNRTVLDTSREKNALSAKINDLETKISRHLFNESACTARIEALEKQLRDCQTNLETSRTNYSNALYNFRANYVDMEDDTGGAKPNGAAGIPNNVKKLSAQLDSSRSPLETSRTQLISQTQLEVIRTQLESSQTQLKESQARVANLGRENIQLREQVDMLQDRLKRVVDDRQNENRMLLNECQAEGDRLRGLLEVAGDNYERVRVQLERRESEYGKQESLHAEQERMRADLFAQQESAWTDKVERMRAEIAKYRDECSRRVDEYLQALDQCKGELDLCRTQLAYRNRQVGGRSLKEELIEVDDAETKPLLKQEPAQSTSQQQQLSTSSLLPQPSPLNIKQEPNDQPPPPPPPPSAEQIRRLTQINAELTQYNEEQRDFYLSQVEERERDIVHQFETAQDEWQHQIDQLYEAIKSANCPVPMLNPIKPPNFRLVTPHAARIRVKQPHKLLKKNYMEEDEDTLVDTQSITTVQDLPPPQQRLKLPPPVQLQRRSQIVVEEATIRRVFNVSAITSADFEALLERLFNTFAEYYKVSGYQYRQNNSFVDNFQRSIQYLESVFKEQESANTQLMQRANDEKGALKKQCLRDLEIQRAKCDELIQDLRQRLEYNLSVLSDKHNLYEVVKSLLEGVGRIRGVETVFLNENYITAINVSEGLEGLYKIGNMNDSFVGTLVDELRQCLSIDATLEDRYRFLEEMRDKCVKMKLLRQIVDEPAAVTKNVGTNTTRRPKVRRAPVQQTQPPVTQPPVTQPPVTQPPVTQPPPVTVNTPPIKPPVTQPPISARATKRKAQPPTPEPPRKRISLKSQPFPSNYTPPQDDDDDVAMKYVTERQRKKLLSDHELVAAYSRLDRTSRGRETKQLVDSKLLEYRRGVAGRSGQVADEHDLLVSDEWDTEDEIGKLEDERAERRRRKKKQVMGNADDDNMDEDDEEQSIVNNRL